MNLKDKQESLNYFQTNALKSYISLGFSGDNSNMIFGIIIEFRNMAIAATQQDTILLNKYMGIGVAYVANYASIHNLKLSTILDDYTHYELSDMVADFDLEDYLEKIKDDISFVKTMTDEEKSQFIIKCWVSIFPDVYHDDFIKIDRILKTNIEDNKIKYPEKFV